MKAVHSSNMTW